MSVIHHTTELRELIENINSSDDEKRRMADKILDGRYENTANNVIDGKLYISREKYFKDGDHFVFVYIDPKPLIMSPTHFIYRPRIARTENLGTFELQKLASIIKIRGASKMKKAQLLPAVMNSIVFQ